MPVPRQIQEAKLADALRRFAVAVERYPDAVAARVVLTNEELIKRARELKAQASTNVEAVVREAQRAQADAIAAGADAEAVAWMAEKEQAAREQAEALRAEV